MNATPEQLARFAKIIGITPDTHFHLCEPYTIKDALSGIGPTMNLPALDTPAGDDVFLTPFMRWLSSQSYVTEITVMPHGYDGLFMAEIQDSNHCFLGDSNGVHKSATLALITACQSAGVAEIVEIFGRAE